MTLMSPLGIPSGCSARLWVKRRGVFVEVEGFLESSGAWFTPVDRKTRLRVGVKAFHRLEGESRQVGWADWSPPAHHRPPLD